MLQWQTITIFILIFLAVTGLGFWAVRWRPGDLSRLHEWGIGGRRFGAIITWFLLGGDIYTSYTFIAVPALLFGEGAFGFFPVPYLIFIYTVMFMILPRFWTLARHRGYVTFADFVAERFESRELAMCIALTGILATMPYIALQLYGLEVVLAAMGVPVEASLVLAFLILAAYTYTSGLRAPALIALIKDLCIWAVVLAIFIAFFMKFPDPGAIFSATPRSQLLLSPGQYSAYASLALGSAAAQFLYPHAITGVLASNSREVVRKTSAYLLIYTLVLGLIAAMGFMAHTAGIHPSPDYGANSIVPTFIAFLFPSWMRGFAFATIAIGALVPASIMSIAAANLFTRNVYREYIRPTCTEREEANAAKSASLVVKFGALLFIIFLPTTFAINLQLLGGVWILQTLPAVLVGLYTNWLHRRALIIGWVAGMLIGTWMAITQHFTSSVFPLSFLGISLPIYAAVAALAVNLFLSWVFTLLYNFIGVEKGEDATSSTDYAAQPIEAASHEQRQGSDWEIPREYTAPRLGIQSLRTTKRRGLMPPLFAQIEAGRNHSPSLAEIKPSNQESNNNVSGELSTAVLTPEWENQSEQAAITPADAQDTTSETG